MCSISIKEILSCEGVPLQRLLYITPHSLTHLPAWRPGANRLTGSARFTSIASSNSAGQPLLSGSMHCSQAARRALAQVRLWQSKVPLGWGVDCTYLLTAHCRLQVRRGLLGAASRHEAPRATFASVASGDKVCILAKTVRKQPHRWPSTIS